MSLLFFLPLFTILLCASYMDIRTREVSDHLWLAGIATWFAVLLVAVTFTNYSPDIVLLLLSVAITFALSAAIFYLGFFGGADAKALILISLYIPSFTPLHAAQLWELPLYISPIFSISVLNNSLVLSSLLTIFILARNILWKLRHRTLFDGFENEKIQKKVLALLVAYKKPANDVFKNRHKYFIVERLNSSRFFEFSARIKEKAPDESSLRQLDYIWVSPALPFLVVLTLACLISLFFGDMIIILVLTVLT